MPFKVLLMASQIREAKFSSPVLITVFLSLTSIKALFGSDTRKNQLFPDPPSPRPIDTTTPILRNAVKRLPELRVPQYNNGLGFEGSNCSFWGTKRCLPDSIKSSPFNLANFVSPFFNFIQQSWEANSAAISNSEHLFKLGMRSVSFSEKWANSNLLLREEICRLEISGNYCSRR